MLLSQHLETSVVRGDILSNKYFKAAIYLRVTQKQHRVRVRVLPGGGCQKMSKYNTRKIINRHFFKIKAAPQDEMFIRLQSVCYQIQSLPNMTC